MTALSSREREVLNLIAQGFSNREIGTQLNISEETVKSQVRAILHKFGARNRAHAVALDAVMSLERVLSAVQSAENSLENMLSGIPG